jgi:hypothetical protein
MSEESPAQPKSEVQPTATKEPWWRSKGLWLGLLANGLFWLILNGKDVTLWILQLASLGNQAIQQQLETEVYTRAAVGLHEAPSVQILTLVLLVVGFATLGLAIRIFARLHPPEKKRRLKRLPLGFRIFCYFAIVYIVGCGAYVVTKFAISIQATFSTAHFQQMLTIARPYLTGDQEMRIRSRFAQMETQAEYVKIDDELRRIIKEHKLNSPKFNSF